MTTTISIAGKCGAGKTLISALLVGPFSICRRAVFAVCAEIAESK
jgi:CO dehydrogenase nickel-insertion accessory protein CooC1